MLLCSSVYVMTIIESAMYRLVLAFNRVPTDRSGKTGKISKTFSSQGNQGKMGCFQPKSGKIFSNQGHFSTVGR